MNPSWVSYPFSLLKKRPLSISITTPFCPRTSMINCSNSPPRACSGILQHWLTCSLYCKQTDSLSSMQKMDQDDKSQAMTSWTSLLRRNSTKFNFKQFIEKFYHLVVSMLSGRPKMRVNEEVPIILHLSNLTKTRDWYLYQNHKEIRVYGCELVPYKLPTYFPVTIFSLEFIRQMINSDVIHFLSLKKKQPMRIKGKIGPFIYNSRAAGEEAYKLLNEMKFSTSFTWHYDPCGIIVEMRSKNKISSHAHTLKPEIEKYVNQTEWEVSTLEDTEQ
jgi:hypothetical protein